MKTWMNLLGCALVVALPAPAGAQQAAPAKPAVAYDASLFKSMEYRNIGPYRGGRATAVAGVVNDTNTFYMGSTGGGVWKTTDGGDTWINITDGQLQSASVGAIAVSATDPNVIYVGMGSACPRGNISPGDGVYKSTDAGKTWKNVGLKEAGQIGAIRIHPTNPDLVYVAALGHLFGPNPERGVFRSKDGGATWEKALYVSEKAGAVDISMDAGNPRILYAAIWPVVRLPWTLISGGEGGGIHKTTDGGDTWTKLTGGLPQGTTGRIGVAVSPANSNRVWAIIEAEDGGIFRSEDGGQNFRNVNSDRNYRQRAWYYTHIVADPADENTVYVMNTGLYRSVDGGRTYEMIRDPHGDNHGLWIHPKNPNIMINSNDGGANVSYNGGKSWSTQANQPTAEFYRVTTDARFPYRVYGAQQDNSTVSIPSRTSGFGVTIQDWYDVGGGESGHIAVDPRDPDVVYAGSYGGHITRYDHETGQTRNVMAYPQGAIGQAARDLKYRFQWNAPIRISTHDPKVLYHTSNFVHKSTNEGQSWTVVSPDLTRNDREKQDYSGGPLTWDNTGIEVYGVVFAFEESPLNAGLLWAGSDDGLVHLSKDGGANWENVTPMNLPEWGQVNMIEPSPHDPARAFIAVTKYKLDDFKPYLFRTDDYGKTWKLLTDGKNGIPAGHFTRVVREDPDRKGLLYAGTEFGMYASFNDGATWQPLQLNLPLTPITDLQVKNQDLVVATQGRAFWILDDLTPLHQMSDEVARAKAFLFKPRETRRMGGFSFEIPGVAVGKNPPSGVVLSYYLAEEPKDEVKIDILDAAGRLIRSFSSKTAAPTGETDFFAQFFGGGGPPRVSTKAGANRFIWDLRYAGAEIERGAVFFGGTTNGPLAVPGTYQARLSVGDWNHTRSFTVKQNTNLATTQEDFQKQFDLALQIRDKISEAHKAIGQIRDVRTQVNEITERLKKAGQEDGIDPLAKSLTDKLTAIEEKLVQTKSKSGQDALNFPPQLDSQFAALNATVQSTDAKPTDGCYPRFEELKTELAGHLAKLKEALETDLTAFNAKVKEKGVPAVVLPAAPRPTL